MVRSLGPGVRVRLVMAWPSWTALEGAGSRERSSRKRCAVFDFEPYPVTCPGCGRDVILEVPEGTHPTMLREPNGRTTFAAGGVAVHQCGDGAFAW